MSGSNALAVTRRFSAYQKEWFADVRSRVEAGAPLAIVGVDTPYEILEAIGIPFVVAPWWSSLLSARQEGTGLFDALEAHGYPGDQTQYVALGLAAAYAPELAPWGGLPTPSLIVSNQATGPEHKIMQLWACETGAELFAFERYRMLGDDPRWWEGISHDWMTKLRPTALTALTAEMAEFVTVVERIAGRPFETARLAEVIALSNRQARALGEAHELLGDPRRGATSIAETIPATTIPQWHSGTEWGANAAEALAAEVRERTEPRAETSSVHRMLWMGNPPWFDMRMFARLRERCGAEFVWSMYLAVAGDGYRREGEEALRLLAARHGPHRDLLSSPPWNAAWIAHEAQRYGVEGAVLFITDVDRGWEFIRARLDDAGIPVLEVNGDAVDPRTGSANLDDVIAEFVARLGRPERA